MKYFVAKESNGIISITSPVPPNYRLYKGESLILSEIPDIDLLTQKFIINDGELKIESKTKFDTDQDKIDSLSNSIKTIDENTKKEILKGFEFDGQTFSLSANAQINWQGMLSLKTASLFSPTEISTIDDQVYLLTISKLDAFIIAGRDKLQLKLAEGRSSKQALKSV